MRRRRGHPGPGDGARRSPCRHPARPRAARRVVGRRRAGRLVDPGHDGDLGDLDRVVAVGRPADQLVTQAEGEDDLGRRREQGDDAHPGHRRTDAPCRQDADAASAGRRVACRACPARPSAPTVTSTARSTVVVSGVWKRFGTTDVVRDLSFEVRRGELLGFLGPNGAGKTTTMRMILDIIRPDRGRISVFGGLPGVEHQQRVGYLPEDRGLYRDVPIIDTLTYFGALRGMSTSASRARARQLLEEVGLGDSMTKKGAELSRGMHQKAQLIATIMNEPDLLIVDEPFQGLDPVNAELLKGVLLAQRDRGAAVVMSTHDMGDAQTLCDRILLINDGQRVLYGTVPVVREAFSDGAVEVVGRDIPTDPRRCRASATCPRSTARCASCCATAHTASDLFRELAATDATVERFSVDAPDLGEIFIRAVAGDPRTAQRRMSSAPTVRGRPQARAARLPAAGGHRRPPRLRPHRQAPRLHRGHAAAAARPDRPVRPVGRPVARRAAPARADRATPTSSSSTIPTCDLRPVAAAPAITLLTRGGRGAGARGRASRRVLRGAADLAGTARGPARRGVVGWLQPGCGPAPRGPGPAARRDAAGRPAGEQRRRPRRHHACPDTRRR